MSSGPDWGTRSKSTEPSTDASRDEAPGVGVTLKRQIVCALIAGTAALLSACGETHETLAAEAVPSSVTAEREAEMPPAELTTSKATWLAGLPMLSFTPLGGGGHDIYSWTEVDDERRHWMLHGDEIIPLAQEIDNVDVQSGFDGTYLVSGWQEGESGLENGHEVWRQYREGKDTFRELSESEYSALMETAIAKRTSGGSVDQASRLFDDGTHQWTVPGDATVSVFDTSEKTVLLVANGDMFAFDRATGEQVGSVTVADLAEVNCDIDGIYKTVFLETDETAITTCGEEGVGGWARITLRD